jgi:hypothetical protein
MARRLTRSELLPPSDFNATNTVDADRLSFIASNEQGTRQALISFAKQPGSHQLRLDLITAMAYLNGPRGRWRSAETALTHYDAISSFLRWLDREGLHPESVTSIDGAIWKQWILHNGGASTSFGVVRIHNVRNVLRSVPGLSESLISALARRTGKPPPTLQTSYTYDEFRQIRRTARQVVHRASRRIGANNNILNRYRSGESLSAGLTRTARALSEVLELGMELSDSACDQLGVKTSKRSAQDFLFLTPHEAWACAVLLTVEAGWNPSVVHELAIPDNVVGAAEGKDVYTIRIDKPRRGRHRHSTTTEVVEPGVGTGRALKWIITATNPARDALAAIEQPTDRLIIYCRRKGYTATSRFAFGCPDGTVRGKSSWAPFSPISLQRLRRTRQVLFDRTPMQNTRDTHEDAYILNDSATREETRPVIELGLNNALTNAGNYVELRIVAEELVEERIRSGSGDTVIAACTDFHHNPGTATTCTDSFLACLGCPNSIATPRHLGRLVLLHAALDELRSVLTETEWQRSWAIHYQRVSSVITRHTTDAERAQAMLDSTDADRDLIGRLLDGELSE